MFDDVRINVPGVEPILTNFEHRSLRETLRFSESIAKYKHVEMYRQKIHGASKVFINTVNQDLSEGRGGGGVALLCGYFAIKIRIWNIY